MLKLIRRSTSVFPRVFTSQARTMSEFFKGVELENKEGASKDGAEALNGKLTALYFAADWCPDCRDFQPILNEFYEAINKDKKQFEIVFIGSDRTNDDQVKHFREKQGPWWMLPFDHDLRNNLKKKYGVCAGKEQAEVGVKERKGGIPSLVIIQPNGYLTHLKGAEDVESKGLKAFEKWSK